MCKTNKIRIIIQHEFGVSCGKGDLLKNSNKLNLDQYYTSEKVADYCLSVARNVLKGEKITEVIEPSAGNGVFSKKIKNCIAYDIEPKDDSIIKQDFLELPLEYKQGRLFIGNPPFGKGNYLSVKFFKKCVQYGDYIAFILPISQLKNNYYMYEFDLIHSEDLGKKEYSDRDIHCCFNIYKRPIGGELNKSNILELKDLKLTGVAKGKSRNDKVPEKYDFSISGFGASVGKICDYEYQYCQQIYFQILNNELKDRVYELIKIADWKKMYNMTSTPKIKHWMIYKYLKENIKEIN